MLPTGTCGPVGLSASCPLTNLTMLMPGRVAEVVGRVVVGDGRARRAVGVRAGDRADVGLLAGQGGGGGGVSPGLGQVEQAVAVGVAGEAGDRSRLVVGDGHVGERHVARVGHDVSKRHRAAHRHVRPGRRIGVLPVDELDDLNARGVAKVIVRIRRSLLNRRRWAVCRWP